MLNLNEKEIAGVFEGGSCFSLLAMTFVSICHLNAKKNILTNYLKVQF